MSNRTTPQAWAQLFAVTYNASDPEIPVYQQALVQTMPAQIHGFSIGNTDSGYQGGTASWLPLGLLMLQQHAIMYLKRKPGDCGTASSIQAPNQTLGVAGGLTGTSTGLLSNLKLIGGNVPLIGSIISGAAEFGQVFEDIFAAPDKDILHERAVLCPLSGQMTQILRALDSAVASGQQSPSNALNSLSQVAQQAHAALNDGSYSAQENPARTFGCFDAWIQAHVIYRENWYPRLVADSTETSQAGAALSSGTFTKNLRAIAAGAELLHLAKVF